MCKTLSMTIAPEDDPGHDRAVVVNVRRTKADVYIGRPSKWGNPFPIVEGQDRDAVIAKYRRWLWDSLADGTIHVSELAALHGKTLGCYCAPRACHGDVLVRAAAWAYASLEDHTRP